MKGYKQIAKEVKNYLKGYNKMSKGFLKSLPELDLNNMEDMKLLLKSYIDEMIKLFNFPSKLEYEIIVFEKEYFSIDITSENEKYNATIKRIYD